MKKKSYVLICLIFALYITGCTGSNSSVEKLTTDAKDDYIKQEVADPIKVSDGLIDFSFALMSEAYIEEENSLLSPYSILTALSMTATGAKGDTLQEFDTVLGGNSKDRNGFLADYNKKNMNSSNVHSANSIWIGEGTGFQVEENFLKDNSNYYKSDIFTLPFDHKAVKTINNWVKDKTDKRIPSIIDNIPEDAIMYIVNAIAFEAKWPEAYKKKDVIERKFTTGKGKTVRGSFMHSNESTYMENDFCEGFVKDYKGGDYSYIAILPKEGISIPECLGRLNAETYKSLLSNAETFASISMPKFKLESKQELSSVLKQLGMPLAFDPKNADFTAMGSCEKENIFVSRVLHSATLEVGEKGTKAGAATAVEMKKESAVESPKSLIFNRPFIVMVVDHDVKMPLFMAVVNDIRE